MNIDYSDKSAGVIHDRPELLRLLAEWCDSQVMERGCSDGLLGLLVNTEVRRSMGVLMRLFAHFPFLKSC